jgi:hypothetical protein
MGMAYRKLIGDGLPGRRCDRDPSGGADERPEAHGESYEQRHEEEAEQRSDEQVHHLSHSDVGTARWRGLAASVDQIAHHARARCADSDEEGFIASPSRPAMIWPLMPRAEP